MTKTVVLVDAENFNADAAVQLCERANPDLAAFVGDFHRRELASWASISPRATEVRFINQYAGGKNASDIALTVAAMQLIDAGVGTLYLASADHDFGPLIRHFEGRGIRVIQALMNDRSKPCHTDVFYISQPPVAPSELIVTVIQRLAMRSTKADRVLIRQVVSTIRAFDVSERQVVRAARSKGWRIDKGYIYVR